MLELSISDPASLFVQPLDRPVAPPFASYEAAACFVDQLAAVFDELGGARATRAARSYRAVAAALRLESHAGFIDGISYRVRQVNLPRGHYPC